MLLDAPPSGIKRVEDHSVNRKMLVIRPLQGRKIRVSVADSAIAPEPGESPEDYERRKATTPMPPQEWWAASFADAGVKVVRHGWARSWTITGVVVLAVLVLSMLAYALST